MKKKIVLVQNERSKKSYETKTKKVINQINDLIAQCKKELGIDISNVSDAVEFIKSYTTPQDALNKQFQYDLLHKVYKDDVDSFMKGYPNIDNDKALEMFIKDEHVKSIEHIINQCVEVNKELIVMNIGITLDTLVISGEFMMNSKVDTKIKDQTTIYCTNKKQVELKVLAEELQGIIHKAIRLKLVSNSALGINVGNIIDASTGDINFQYIHNIRG
jgi:hypothetical protein